MELFMIPFEKQINIERTKIIKDDKELKEISGTELQDEDLENISGGDGIFMPSDFFRPLK